MIKSNKLLSVLVITLLLSACGSSTTNEEADKAVNHKASNSKTKQEVIKLVETPVAAEELTKEKIIDAKDEFSSWQRGRVQFLNLEGGFYGIIMDSGKKILPMNMKKEFAQNGAIIRIKGKVKDIMTIQQWGTPFTITDIELITPGSKVNDADM